MLLALTLQVMLRLYGPSGMVKVAHRTYSSCPSSSPAGESSDSLSWSGNPHSLVSVSTESCFPHNGGIEAVCTSTTEWVMVRPHTWCICFSAVCRLDQLVKASLASQVLYTKGGWQVHSALVLCGPPRRAQHARDQPRRHRAAAAGPGQAPGGRPAALDRPPPAERDLRWGHGLPGQGMHPCLSLVSHVVSSQCMQDGHAGSVTPC